MSRNKLSPVRPSDETRDSLENEVLAQREERIQHRKERLTNLERLNLIIDFIKTNNQPEGYTIREIKDKEGNEKYIVRKNKKLNINNNENVVSPEQQPE